MAEINAGAAAKMGADIILPGSTHGGLLEDPSEGWSVVFGDESTALVTVDGTLDELEKALDGALSKVRHRKSLLGLSMRNVEVQGDLYTVPAALYRDGMNDGEVIHIAVAVEERDED